MIAMIGNLDWQSHSCGMRPFFLQQVVDSLRTGDYFLLGVDLHKDKEQLEAAYNDDQGVEAEFITNMLCHLNSRFSGNFNINNFQHVALYNEQCHQMEIYLKSLAVQKVQLNRLGLTVDMKEGETIRTVVSRKFVLERLKLELEAKHLHCVGMWTDPNTCCRLLHKEFCQQLVGTRYLGQYSYPQQMYDISHDARGKENLISRAGGGKGVKNSPSVMKATPSSCNMLAELEAIRHKRDEAAQQNEPQSLDLLKANQYL
eukprot:Em0726g1a